MSWWRRFLVVALSLAVALGVAARNEVASAKPVKEKTGCKSKAKSPVPKDALAASPFVVGNASPPLAPGDPKKPTVIAVGAQTVQYDIASGSIPIVIRNNSCKALKSVKVSATARDAAGQLIGTGSDQGIDPPRLAPGEVGFGHVYFPGDVTFPPDVRYEFNVTGQESKTPEDTSGNKPLAITEHNINIQSEYGNTTATILGIAQNQSKSRITGPISVTAICFNQAGQPVAETGSFADVDVLEPGASAPFNAAFYGLDACPTYLISSSGYAR